MTNSRGDWGLSLETYLRWVGSPGTGPHEGSTPHRALRTKKWSPLFLQSLLGSESRRHHQSSQRYKRKARAGEDFEASGGRDSRAHLVPRQRGSTHTGNSSGTCGFEGQEWVQYARVLSKGFRTTATQQWALPSLIEKASHGALSTLSAIFLLVDDNTRIHLPRKHGVAENNICSEVWKMEF